MYPDMSTDRVSLDIVDQSAYGPGGPAEPTGVLIAHSQAPRSNDNQVENQPSRLSRLAAPLTGYHLLNIVSVLVFGTWKVVVSDHEGLVVVTRVELILVMISGLVLYYAKMLERRPDVCPGFYKVNLAPPIWRFVYRSEVYLFLLSLLPLWPAVTLLRSALDVRQRVELGNRLPGSYAIARNALIAAVVVLVFALLAILQQFTKVMRLRALHRFLAQDNVSLTLLGVWALSDFYVLFHTTTSIDYLSAEDIDTTEEYLFGHTMAIVPFALLLPRVEESGIGPLWFQLLKGVLVVVLFFGWVLSQKFRNPHYVSFVCGVMIFFLHRFLAVFYGKFWRAASKAWRWG